MMLDYFVVDLWETWIYIYVCVCVCISKSLRASNDKYIKIVTFKNYPYTLTEMEYSPQLSILV